MAPETAPRAARREDGFTVVEMAVTIALIAALFIAVAIVLESGLRALGASKARARANNIATQGIEDLQRFGFNNLGLCSPPTGTAPSGLDDWVKLPSCPTPVPYEEPCNGLVGSVPKAEYTCVRNNITYTVKRYVAWVDALRTTKRLAVFVEWIDSAGRHQVAQQSSLRAPDQGAITGLAPPAFSSAQPPTAVGSSSPLPITASSNLAPGSSITFTAKTSNLSAPAATSSMTAIPAHTPNDIFDITVANGTAFPSYNGFPVTIDVEAFTVIAGAGTNNWRILAGGTAAHSGGAPVAFAGDRVYAALQTIGANNAPQSETVFLTSSNGSDWTTTVDSSSALKFGAGSQYVSFGILRASDGKSSSAFATPALRFCPDSNPSCLGMALPSLNVTQAPAAVALGPSGELTNDVVVKVQTTNITNADTVTVGFLTQAGSVTIVLTQDPAFAACPTPQTATAGVTCNWIGTIAKASGYRFAAGTQQFYFGAAQIVDTVNPASIDKGSTGAASSNTVTFG